MTDVLASWNDGPARSAILDFVTAVTMDGSAAFVPPAERIATFDNDGTLWLEKPAYIQILHGLHVIGRMAAANPELRDRQPFKAVYENDEAWLGEVAADYATDSSGFRALAAGFAEGREGTTVEDFEMEALEFLSTARDPRFNRPYTQLTYAPMVELVHYLQSAGFDVYLSSGGGRDFMRAVCEEIYGIPRAMAIGSSVTFEYAEDAQGVAQVVRSREIDGPRTTDPASRSTSIAPSGVGRSWPRATPAATSTCSSTRPATRARRWVCSCTTTTPSASTPTMAARRRRCDWRKEGWIVVSMKDDWKTVFAGD